jgi:hypothetical protein
MGRVYEKGKGEGNIHSIAFNPLWNTKRAGEAILIRPSRTCRVNRSEIELREYRIVSPSTCARDALTDGDWIRDEASREIAS